MADLSYLFGNSTPASVTNTTSTTDSTLPDWLQDYTRGLMGKATQVAGQEYQPYTGARIADQTADQTQANQQVRDMQGAWQPGLNYAMQTAPSQVNNYMSPYTDSVVNRIAQLGQRNLTENLLPQVNSTFTGAGQFGSTRNGEFEARALRDANESILGQQANALQSGYQNAISNFQNDATRIGNAANMSTQLGYQDAGMLSQIGQQQQALDQNSLDLAYRDFLQQRDYPKNNLQFLDEIVRGLPVTKSTVQDKSDINPIQTMSPLQQAAAAFTGLKSTLSSPMQQPQTAGR